MTASFALMRRFSIRLRMQGAIAMVLGLVAVLLFGGFVTDIKHGLQSEFVRRTGHLQVQQKDYFRLQAFFAPIRLIPEAEVEQQLGDRRHERHDAARAAAGARWRAGPSRAWAGWRCRCRSARRSDR